MVYSVTYPLWLLLAQIQEKLLKIHSDKKKKKDTSEATEKLLKKRSNEEYESLSAILGNSDMWYFSPKLSKGLREMGSVFFKCIEHPLIPHLDFENINSIASALRFL